MCDKCDIIDKTIARYKWLKGQIPDHQIHHVADNLMVKLDAEKRALHPKD